MRNIFTLLTYVFFALISTSCDNKDKNGNNGHENDNNYTNPIINVSLPDPTIVEAPDGYFYLYATEDIRNIPIYKSKNLVKWEFIGTAFTDSTRPDFVPNGGIWAPNVELVDNKYVMYYSMSEWGKEWDCGIGIAIAENPAGPFKDLGKLFTSREIDVQNSIDPCFAESEGKKYLFWGSFRGIYAIELANNGLSIMPNSTKIKVAGTAFEGVHIHERDGYYYMFASIGSCCEGVKSTYELVVGRSQNILGPYVDKNGKPMLDNGYTLVIGSNNKFVGNGHCSQLVKDKDGNDYIFYHGINVDKPNGRVLLMDKVEWTKDGWPYVEGNSPSLTAKNPVF